MIVTVNNRLQLVEQVSHTIAGLGKKVTIIEQLLLLLLLPLLSSCFTYSLSPVSMAAYVSPHCAHSRWPPVYLVA
jgi:hypothetical protein